MCFVVVDATAAENRNTVTFTCNLEFNVLALKLVQLFNASMQSLSEYIYCLLYKRDKHLFHIYYKALFLNFILFLFCTGPS